MTLPASGTLTLGGSGSNSINQEFGLGTNLAAYRGVQWWQDNTATGYFTSTNLGMNQFYSKRSNTPVTPGSTTLPYGTTSWTVPLYSILSVTVRAGGGGGGGGSSNTSGGGAGVTGGPSSFGVPGNGFYKAASGGTGGYPGGNGTAGGPSSDGSPAGGSGGAAGYAGYPSGGSGGAGGKDSGTFTNPISGGPGPTVGSSVPVSIGAGGAGGGGGSGIVYTGFPPFYYAPANGGGGSTGGNGYIELSWS